MRFGLEFLTSAGVREAIDFQSGRFAGELVIDNVTASISVPPPDGISLSDVVTHVKSSSSETGFAFSVEFNITANRIEIIKAPNVTYAVGGGRFHFIFVRFQ